MYSQPKSQIKEIINLLISIFLKQEDHQNPEFIEVQLDCVEYFLSTVPESLLQHLGQLTVVLL